jgi:hypothetical protein
MKWGLVTLAVLLVSCKVSGPQTLNTNPPTYIQSLAVYREGYDGLMIYFVLVDAKGQPTTASGQLHLEIQDWCGTTDPLYMVSKFFGVSEFSRATVGQGPYAGETILYSFGRVPYHTFRRTPSDREATIELSMYVSGQKFQASKRVLLR